MNEVCSIASPVAAGTATAREASRSLLRWITLGAAVLALSVLAMLHGTSVGAASPYPPNSLVSTYFDPRYCDGSVSVVSDAGSNLINICTTTGQRIYPVYQDYGYPNGYVAGNYINGYVNNGYVNPYVNNGYANAYVNNGYVNPYVNNGAYFNGAYTNGLYGNGIFNNGLYNNTVPAGATNVGGVLYYNDNRFCTDGKIAFVPGQGYFCQNGGPLVPNGVNTVNCSNFFYNGCGAYRVLEVSSSTTQPAATTGTTSVTAAPAAAATTQTATALNASQTQATASDAGGSGVKILSVQSATTPVTQNDGREDGK